MPYKNAVEMLENLITNCKSLPAKVQTIKALFQNYSGRK